MTRIQNTVWQDVIENRDVLFGYWFGATFIGCIIGMWIL